MRKKILLAVLLSVASMSMSDVSAATLAEIEKQLDEIETNNTLENKTDKLESIEAALIQKRLQIREDLEQPKNKAGKLSEEDYLEAQTAILATQKLIRADKNYIQKLIDRVQDLRVQEPRDVAQAGKGNLSFREKLKKNKGYKEKRATQGSFSIQELEGQYSSDLTEDDVRKILEKKFCHLSVLFDNKEDKCIFTGRIQVVDGNTGSATKKLYLIRNNLGKLVLIFKQLKDAPKSRREQNTSQIELDNLVAINRNSKLSNMPLNQDFPILSWVEKLYTYTDADQKTHYLSVIDSARGEPLVEYVKSHQNAENLKKAFYVVGQALASFNLYMAGGKTKGTQTGSLAALNDRLEPGHIHKDLHWNNIFIKSNGAAERAYWRVYLIDNESIVNTTFSNLIDEEGKIEDRIRAQLTTLYAVPLFRWEDAAAGELNKASLQGIVTGIIDGYASKFENQQLIKKELAQKIMDINKAITGEGGCVTSLDLDMKAKSKNSTIKKERLAFINTYLKNTYPQDGLEG